VNLPTSSEINEAMQAFFMNATQKEIEQLVAGAAESEWFLYEVATTIRRLLAGQCPSAALGTCMMIALSAGMRIERKRYEVGMLERMYGGGAE